MKNFSLALFALFSVFAINSCSKNEDPIPVVVVANFTSLDLSSSSNDNILIATENLTFKVVGDDGVDYTNEAAIFVNGTEISGSNYTFNDEGVYDVKANYLNVTSNTLNFEVVSNSERIVTVDRNKSLRNQMVTFQLLDADNNNYTAEATFYVNGSAITGNTFTSANEGTFEVYAQYEIAGETLNSPVKTFEYYIPKRKVVIEDYTGTWCGYCPEVVLAIEDVETVTHDIAVVAIHKTSFSLPDPMHFDRIQELQDEFGVPDGFPKAQTNRTIPWVAPYPKEQVTIQAGTDTNVAISIDSQLSGSNLSVEVKVVYENGSEAGDKVVVYLLESGIVYPQANYFNTTQGHPYFGLGNPIPNYVHNDALRNSLSNLFGDNIPATAAFEEFSKTYSFSVPSEYNSENLSFVVMVVKADNSAKNAQVADVNENKDFE